MDIKILKIKFDESLGHSDYLQRCHALLIEIRGSGCKSTEAMEALQLLRDDSITQGAGEREDRILEVMDYVTSFCREDLRVW